MTLLLKAIITLRFCSGNDILNIFDIFDKFIHIAKLFTKSLLFFPESVKIGEALTMRSYHKKERRCYH
jgi:hypothetical protein